jgi:hypothetical protein
MDEERIFIANLSKGKIGEENSRLLGSFLVAQFQLAAMQRANTGEGERRDFHLYIDEFQNFTTDSSILSEARKYRLCLALEHQYISQLPESLRSAVFGNVGTMIALRVGYQDAEILAAHSTLRDRTPWRLTRSPTGTGKSRTDTYQDPATACVLLRGRDTLIQNSRDRFATRRAVMERKIKQWMGH